MQPSPVGGLGQEPDLSEITNALASSDTFRVTTDTTIGSGAGESSKHSLASCSTSTLT
ncbi:MAG TPA: hypothetical protein VF635_14160 [Propionibacteriaceae bacterium]